LLQKDQKRLMKLTKIVRAEYENKRNKIFINFK